MPNPPVSFVLCSRETHLLIFIEIDFEQQIQACVCTVGVVIMHSTKNFNMWGAGYDYTTYSKNFLLSRFISIYYTAIAHSA